MCVFCVFHHPFPPLPCVCKAIYNILYVNCAVQKQEKQKQSSSVSAWSRCTRLQCCNISTSPFAFSACLLLAHKAHVHAVGRHGPRCLPQAMIRDSHSFLCKTLKHIIQHLIWKCDLRARDSASVCVKVPDSIILLSVCTLTVKEWEPGTVSAWSHSNLDVLLWGLSLPLLLGFRASHTPTAVACSHNTVTNSYRQLHPHNRILFPFSRLIILVDTVDVVLASIHPSYITLVKKCLHNHCCKF